MAAAADLPTAGKPEIVSPELVLVDPRLAIDARWLLRHGARADEFIEAGDHALVVGIHWVAEDGGRGQPLVFQNVTVRDRRIRHIQDYRRKEQALKAANAV